MGERSECPVCKAYTSSVNSAFYQERECPYCHTSYETILLLQDIEVKKKYYHSQGVQLKIIEENEALKKELILWKEKMLKFEEFKLHFDYQFHDLKSNWDEFNGG